LISMKASKVHINCCRYRLEMALAAYFSDSWSIIQNFCQAVFPCIVSKVLVQYFPLLFFPHVFLWYLFQYFVFVVIGFGVWRTHQRLCHMCGCVCECVCVCVGVCWCVDVWEREIVYACFSRGFCIVCVCVCAWISLSLSPALFLFLPVLFSLTLSLSLSFSLSLSLCLSECIFRTLRDIHHEYETWLTRDCVLYMTILIWDMTHTYLYTRCDTPHWHGTWLRRATENNVIWHIDMGHDSYVPVHPMRHASLIWDMFDTCLYTLCDMPHEHGTCLVRSRQTNKSGKRAFTMSHIREACHEYGTKSH